MRTNSYYLVRPKSSLVQLTTDMDELSRDVLRESQLWQSPEGGKSLWTLEDYALRAKLAFLIYLKTEYRGAPGVDLVLSGAKIGGALFDSHWEIEPLELKGDVNEISISLLDRAEVDLSGQEIVDSWLQGRVRRVAPSAAD